MMENGDVSGWQFDRYPNGDDGELKTPKSRADM